MGIQEKKRMTDCIKTGVIFTICLLFLYSLFVLPVQAEESKVVRVGYYLHKTYQEGGEGEIKSGYGYEYLQTLRNYTGWEYEYIYADSWEEQVSMLQRGEVDLILHAFKTDERMKTMLFSVEPMGREMNYLYTRGDHPELKVGDIASVNGKTVGCMAGDFRYDIFKEWCQNNGVESTIVTYEDLTVMHKALLNGEIDAIIGSDFTASSYEGDWMTIQRLGDKAIYIAVAMGREDLLDEVNAAQSEILSVNPYYPDEVRQKYQNVTSTYQIQLTEEERGKLEEYSPLVIGYCRRHRPIAFTDSETGQLQGILKEYLDAMTSAYQISFETKVYDDDNVLLEALKKGEVDAIAPVGFSHGDAEQRGLSITNTITEEAILAVYKSGKGAAEKGVFRQIAALKEFTSGAGFIEYFYPEAEIIYAETVEGAMALVESGKADCFITDSSTWAWNGGRYADDNELQTMSLPNPRELSMAVRAEDVELIPVFNKGIKLLSKTDISHATIAYSDASEEVTWWTLVQDNPVTAFVITFAIILSLVLLFVVYRLGTERKYADQLKEAKEEAERANLAKSTFLTSMSHDIRTPMNAIVGMTMLAAKRIHDPEYVRSCLGKVTLASDHLLTLINDVLDINKIESGNLSLTPTVFSLADSMMNLANIGRTQIQDKDHLFDIHIHHITQEYLFADELRINQIFINLLSNAVKYTPAGGRITIDLKEEAIPKENDRIRVIFEISDTGIGMTEEFQKHMYEVFSMANKNSRSITGSGVGLAICKQLVDLMEGTIACESKVDKGTKFTVSLDLLVADRMVDNLILPPMKLLLVDDDEIFLTTASETLKELGLSPECVDNGEDAVKAVTEKHEQKQDYPLVIIDWKMEGMDGYETTKAIRSIVGEDVTVIVISAYAVEDIRDAALAAGADGFISKPLFRSQAYKSLSEILGLQKQTYDAEVTHSKVRGMNVLVAEDNDFNWEVAREVLMLYDITSTRAENGRKCLEALEAAAPGEYDVVFMDIQMPEINGYEAAGLIRNHERGDIRKIPVVAMTADAYTEDVVRCAEAGMNAHIPKPIDVEKMLAILEELQN